MPSAHLADDRPADRQHAVDQGHARVRIVQDADGEAGRRGHASDRERRAGKEQVVDIGHVEIEVERLQIERVRGIDESAHCARTIEADVVDRHRSGKRTGRIGVAAEYHEAEIERNARQRIGNRPGDTVGVAAFPRRTQCQPIRVYGCEADLVRSRRGDRCRDIHVIDVISPSPGHRRVLRLEEGVDRRPGWKGEAVEIDREGEDEVGEFTDRQGRGIPHRQKIQPSGTRGDMVGIGPPGAMAQRDRVPVHLHRR